MIVDARIQRIDMTEALDALAEAFTPVTLRVDLTPFSAAPGREIEVSVHDARETEVQTVLSNAHVSTLAIRERPR